METLTSQYTVEELYILMLETVDNAGSRGVMFITDTDIFEVDEGVLYLTHLKEHKNVNHVISRKEIEPYALYLLVDLFENAFDEHLIRLGK